MQHLLQKTIILLITLLGATIIIFAIVRSIPGDPVLVLLGQSPATEEEYQRLKAYLGLDQPLYIQYMLYLQRLLWMDWGRSLFGNEAVFPLIVRRFSNTLKLAALSITTSTAAGTILGTLAALKKGSSVDTACRIVSLMGYSIPVFWLGLLFMLVFSLYMNILPPMGTDRPENLILPVLTLTVYLMGIQSRITRASILDILRQDYIVTAVAKGLPRIRITTAHILRNALIPMITIIGLQFGRLLGGTVIVESIFNYAGLGKLLVDAIFKRDYPVIQACLLFAVIAFCFVNFVVDLLYVYLDPRIRYGKKR